MGIIRNFILWHSEMKRRRFFWYVWMSTRDTVISRGVKVEIEMPPQFKTCWPWNFDGWISSDDDIAAAVLPLYQLIFPSMTVDQVKPFIKSHWIVARRRNV